MLRSLDAQSEEFITSMDRIARRLDLAQRQISSGLRVSTVSDAPDSVSAILQARADLASVQQVQENMARAKSETDAGEGALQSAVSLLERARVIGAQGATATATTEMRQSLATELGSIMEQMVGLTGTAVEGRCIFSGDSDETIPYTINLQSTPPISTYQGSAVTRQIQHPNGTKFAISQSAQQIFDSATPSQNVFTSLQNLRVALQADNTAMISAAAPNIDTSLTHLNGELAFYGTAQNKVANATDFGQRQVTRLKTELSSLQDADMTSSIVEFTQATLQQNATLQVRSKMPKTTLFDYLG